MQSKLLSPKLKINFFWHRHSYKCGVTVRPVDQKFCVPARGHLGYLVVSWYQEKWVTSRQCQNSILTGMEVKKWRALLYTHVVGIFACWTKQEQAWAEPLRDCHPHWCQPHMVGFALTSGFFFPCIYFSGKQKAYLGAEDSGETFEVWALRCWAFWKARPCYTFHLPKHIILTNECRELLYLCNIG